MIIDGKKIASEIKENLKSVVLKMETKPVLSVFVVGENIVTEKFIAIKKRFADDIGVLVEEYRFDENINEQVLIDKVNELSCDKNIHGIVVQLPLPVHINKTKVLNSIGSEKDIDVLSEKTFEKFKNRLVSDNEGDFLPPVLGAMVEILKREKVVVENKKVVIVGRGLLVGIPAEVWFKKQKAQVEVLDINNFNKEVIKYADILVLGAGSPSLIKPDMIKDNVIILDAGTSEEGGKLLGDADKSCADKSSIFTPVPGGIGPITVAVLFRNLIKVKSS